MNETPLPTSLIRLLGGRYRLVEEVARGGMATVHRAVDDVLDREVAVKVLHQHLAHDEVFSERFRREAKAAAGLSHPNVVAVHDWGEGPDGAFIVLEYVDGTSLREVLRVRGRVTPAEALALLAPAAAGLAHAHENGLVHRDVKPENILLGHDGVVKVTDFGLATAAAKSTRTFGDAIVGSPHYLAPEVVDGATVDARADVYALGIVLFELVTGRPPFQGESPMATALQHTTASVPRPSSVPGTPETVDDIVATATRPDPTRRYEDAGEFAIALTDAVPDGPALVDLRDGTRPTVVLPGNARETLVGFESKRKSPRRRGRWRRRLLWLLPLLLAVAGLLVWDQLVAPVTPIPDVRGEALDAAVATLEDAGFSTRLGEEPRYDLDVPADHVLLQDPTGEARRGTTVQLIISAGPRQHVLPPLAGEPEEDALAALDELNVEVDLRRSHHEEVPAGLVISTEPEPGRTIAEGTTVVVTVSQGRRPIDVPDLRGGTLESARATATDLGLVVDVVERRYDDEIPEGVVITQRPDPGSVLFAGDAVEVVVSDGPEPFAVPDVEGETEERATAILQQAGLVVSVQYVDTIFPHREGKVDAQDPPPGSEVRPGDEVTIYVWR
ncbi:MAG: Stk1 family PASTA domain-containing Ser/Thr kinase [Nitriliruptorales bacterium]|nr:Stk1 family PASTA domain-containing Ser/Thr kinase [Nitriliruptorales bacterium]